MLSKEHEVEKKHNRRMLIQILKAVRFLACQGLALRGDSDEKIIILFKPLKHLIQEKLQNGWNIKQINIQALKSKTKC